MTYAKMHFFRKQDSHAALRTLLKAMLNGLQFAFLFALFSSPCGLRGQDLSLYQIGNSHTWDSAPSDGLPELFASAGVNLQNGWHIRCGKSLAYIADHPEEVCVDFNEFGNWVTALGDNRWDAVTLQSHNGSPGRDEIDAIQTILAAIPSYRSTRVLLYINWPRISAHEFRDGWNTTYSSTDQPVIQSYQYFVWLHKAMLDADLSNHSIEYIPIGAVLAELDRRFRAGEYPPFTKVDEFYRDDVHLNNAGRYVAGLTILATLFDYDVRSLGTPPEAYNQPIANFVEIGTEFADYLQSIVWEVVLKKGFSPDQIPSDQEVKVAQEGPQYSFQSFLGYQYLVLESDDLLDWRIIGDFLEGDGSRFSFKSDDAKKFFRLRRF